MKHIARFLIVLVALLAVVTWAQPSMTVSCGPSPVDTNGCATPW